MRAFLRFVLVVLTVSALLYVAVEVVAPWALEKVGGVDLGAGGPGR